MTFVSFADEPVWGDFVNILSQTGDESEIVVGGYTESCINKEFKEAAVAEAANVDQNGEYTYYWDMVMFFEANPD